MKRKLIEDFDREDFKVARFDDSVHSQEVYDGSHYSVSVVKNKEATEIDLSTVMKNFVNIYEKLDTSDEAMLKPNYSYTELVYLALLRSPNFCLPIGEIYKYVQNKFVFFRNNARLHWKNAIRHSLSKNKCFTKINLGRGVSGTSNRCCFLWSIDSCSIINFARGDYRPSVDRNSGTNTLRWGYYHTNAGDFWDQVADVLENKIKLFKATISNCSSPSKMFEQQTCELPNQSSVANLVHQNVTISTPSLPSSNTVCQSPIYNQQSTPPPNVVCQPNGALYSSSTPVLYSSSTPVFYQPYKQVNSSPASSIEASQRNQFLPNTSPVTRTYIDSSPVSSIEASQRNQFLPNTSPVTRTYIDSSPVSSIEASQRNQFLPNTSPVTRTYIDSSPASSIEASQRNQFLPNTSPVTRTYIDSSPVSPIETLERNQFLSDASPVASTYNPSCSQSTPTTSSLDMSSLSCFEALSTVRQSSCMQGPTTQLSSSESTSAWSPVCVTADSEFSKDSGFELSNSDLQSLRDSIPDWMCQSVTGEDSQLTSQSCGSQVDSTSYHSEDFSHEVSVKLPIFPDYDTGAKHFDLSTVPQLNTATNNTMYQNAAYHQTYMYSQNPHYNIVPIGL